MSFYLLELSERKSSPAPYPLTPCLPLHVSMHTGSLGQKALPRGVLNKTCSLFALLQMPHMSTSPGILRRGLRIEALKEFILQQGLIVIVSHVCLPACLHHFDLELAATRPASQG
eukprot:1137380-Pelagomonas_calceolata.AAC.8